MNAEPPAIYLAGPTAVGKSALALELAQRLSGEIISVDSMQVYRGLDIGTAKPSAEERALVPHHLIDVMDLSESFDAAQFVRLAQIAEVKIRNRNRIPIYCGGTGFYFKALLHGLSTAPPSDGLVRSALEATPLTQLLEELQQRDPAAFASIDCQNPRRVIRALEIIRLTNRPFADFQPKINAANTATLFVLNRTSTDLHHRINQRVDRIFDQGLEAETRALLQRGLRENRTAQQALGYRQLCEYFDGEHSSAQVVELVKLRTRQFAKRQLVFFKHQFAARWIDCSQSTTSQTIRTVLNETGHCEQS